MLSAFRRCLVLFIAISTLWIQSGIPTFADDAPAPLLERGHPVDWWFAFKFNTASFPACRVGAVRACIFGGDIQNYAFGQQFVYASSENKTLQSGTGCAGDTIVDPIGATFDQVYNGSFYYVVWNDQFYDDPDIQGSYRRFLVTA
jgi:hypothetical protein